MNAGNERKSSSRRRRSYYDEMYQESYDDFDQDQRSFRVGSRVNHEKFGNGKILQINGIGDSQRISVAFDEYGTKHLLIKFAKLTLM